MHCRARPLPSLDRHCVSSLIKHHHSTSAKGASLDEGGCAQQVTTNDFNVWTAEEVAALKALQTKFGNKWTTIANAMPANRPFSASVVMQKFRDLQKRGLAH